MSADPKVRLRELGQDNTAVRIENENRNSKTIIDYAVSRETIALILLQVLDTLDGAEFEKESSTEYRGSKITPTLSISRTVYS